MIEEYGLYFYREKNELLILFSEQESNNEEQNNNVISLYHDHDLVGYKIPNFINYAKIKNTFLIYFPNQPLIDLINQILANNQLPTLRYKDNSGFIISRYEEKYVVIARDGTFLPDQKKARNNHLCSYFDLSLNNSREIYYLDGPIKIGEDFFMVEDNEYVRN